ncbi:MAG: DNA/RNA nuclease SfsA [Deltaproteobacteria bacterium]|nr:DNA/RNA nuclease SfsA [Candidatus Anaeroferrophillus wilburensis]MBN2889067.1 DNA/RNA nuclease SfsA [Deltaproteobacteria bacterium]
MAAEEKNGLLWPPLIKGRLVRRYKRFLADVQLENGQLVTAHCPNSGRMISCSEPGRPVYLSRANNPKRRLPYTWELIDMPSSLVGVNTIVPNRLVKKAIIEHQIPELDGYLIINSEVPYGQNSRIDLLLSNPEQEKRCYVEIKNCTLVEDGLAMFPDAVTSRGLKHLVELEKQVAEEQRGIIFFLIQRMDAQRFRPADHIDPAYGRQLRHARDHGVELVIYDVFIDTKRISIGHPLPASF